MNVGHVACVNGGGLVMKLPRHLAEQGRRLERRVANPDSSDRPGNDDVARRGPAWASRSIPSSASTTRAGGPIRLPVPARSDAR